MPIGRSSFVFVREKTIGPKSVIIPWGGRKISSGTHASYPASLRLLQKASSSPCSLATIVLLTVPGTCIATIDFEEGDTDKGSWYEMWMAAVAVNEMCVTKGKAGAALGLGKSILSTLSKNDCRCAEMP